MFTLQIITVSTREGRQGHAVASWFETRARAHGKFTVDAIDLADVDLPLFDEPHHPRLRKYEHEHTKAWSEIVARADAYVFVTPEYNYGTPPSLVNALDYLSSEWAYKPAGFVSYGGASGGLRGVQMTKQIVTTLKMMPMAEGVSLPFFSQQIEKETGVFSPGEGQEKAAVVMLDEMLRWAQALKTLRA